MPISGRQVFQEIREAHDVSRAAAELAASTEDRLKFDVEQLVSERGAALMELARLDLPNLRRETIETTLAEIRRELLQIVDRKDRSLDELQGRILRLRESEQAASQALSAAASQVSQTLAEQSRLQGIVQGELQTHPEFPSLSKQAVEAEAALHRDERRVADVQSGAREKLPTYEQSSLFQYLYRRRYLTPGYNHRGWTRRLDRWVSDMIGYPSAKRGYEFLKNTPVLMQNELTRRRGVFHELMARVEQIETEVAERVGLTAVIANVKMVQQSQSRHETELAQTRQLTVKAEDDLARLSQDQCQFYQEALDRYREFLDDTESALLEQRASRTSDPRDDELVSRIEFLNAQIRTLKSRLETTALDVSQAVAVSEGFEFVLRRMQQSNFDEERSQFRSELRLDQLLSRFQQGVLSREALWTELKQRQEFIRSETESTVIDIVNHPVTHVLAEAMVHVVGAALQQGVNRSIQRRSGASGSNWTAPSFPSSSSSSGGGEYKTIDRF